MKVCVKVTPLCKEVHRAFKHFEMHRSCHPVFNYFDSIFNQETWKRAYRDHRRKVETAKAVVDCGPPLLFSYIQFNLKKFKKEIERLRFIERENRWLMERIAFIMRTQDTCDILNDYKQRCDRRKRELQRIDRENKSFQERLASCLPWYQLQRWYENWEIEENFNDSVTEISPACCCSYLVHEISPRRMSPRKRLLKLRQRMMEDWDSDVEDEVMSEDKTQKGDDTNENNMEEKTKISTSKEEEDMTNMLVKEEEKGKYELNQEQMEEIESRLLEDVKSRVAKLEEELETESKMLQEVKTMIKMKEEEEAGQLWKKESKVRQIGQKKKEEKESKSQEDIASKSIEDKESKPMEDTEPKPMEGTESKPMEDIEPKPMEGTESKPMEDIEPKPMEDTESKPMEDTEPKPKEEKEEKPRVTIVETKEEIESKSREETETKRVTLQEPEKRLEDKPSEGEEAVINTEVKEEEGASVMLEGKDSQSPEISQEQ